MNTFVQKAIKAVVNRGLLHIIILEFDGGKEFGQRQFCASTKYVLHLHTYLHVNIWP